jgi:hypothetical protein
VHLGHEMSTHNFSFSGGPGAVSINSSLGHVTLNLVFASGAVCGSRSAFRCVSAMKHRRNIFHARAGLVQIP